MDPYLWGYLLWCLIWEVARTTDAAAGDREDMLLLLYSLRYVIPCKICRGHYADNLVVLPPAESTDFVQWAWLVKEQVNRLQSRTSILTLDHMRVRMAVSRVLLSPQAFWDLALILAHNYPRQGQDAADPEAADKRHAYGIFFCTASSLFDGIPHLRNLYSVRGILRRTGEAPLRTSVRLVSRWIQDPTIQVEPTRSVVVRQPDYGGFMQPVARTTRESDIRQWERRQTSKQRQPHHTPRALVDIFPASTLPQSAPLVEHRMCVPDRCAGMYAWDGPEDAVAWVVKHRRRWEERSGMSNEEMSDNRERGEKLAEVLAAQPESH